MCAIFDGHGLPTRPVQPEESSTGKKQERRNLAIANLLDGITPLAPIPGDEPVARAAREMIIVLAGGPRDDDGRC